MKTRLNLLEKNDEKFIERACRLHYKSKKCKSCKKYKQSNNKIGKIYKKNGKISSKTLKKHNKLSKRCDICASNNTKRCNSKQIKNYSNWYYGK